MNKSLLILGGTGFFGRTFMRSFMAGRLSGWGIEKLIISSRNAVEFAAKNPTYTHKGIQFVNADICLGIPTENPDYILHFAHSSRESDYKSDPEGQVLKMEKNLSSFANAILKSSKKPAGIVFASSGAVYADTDKQCPTERSPLKRIVNSQIGKSYYAEGKIRSEKIFSSLTDYVENLCIARCFAFAGLELPLNEHFFAGNIINHILRNEPLTLRAINPVYRSYLHTDDLVHWLMTLLISGGNSCQIYNVGNDDAVQIQKLALKLAKLYGLRADIPEITEKTVDFYVPHIGKARTLGLKPTSSSFDAITKVIEEHKRQTSV